MLDTAQALLEKIRLGEDSFLELKEVFFPARKSRGRAARNWPTKWRRSPTPVAG